MNHSIENYSERLNKLCRLCGERSYRNQSRKTKINERHHICEQYTGDILLYFRININTDIDGTHSKTFCTKCYNRIISLRKRVSEVTLERASQLVKKSCHLWAPFNGSLTSDQCNSCSTFLTQNKGCISARKTKTSQNNDTFVAASTPTHETSTPDIQDLSLNTDTSEVPSTQILATCKQTNIAPCSKGNKFTYH